MFILLILCTTHVPYLQLKQYATASQFPMFTSTQVIHWLNYHKWRGEPITDVTIPETESFIIMNDTLEQDFSQFRETYSKLFSYHVLFSSDLLNLWVVKEYESKEDVQIGTVFGKNCYFLTGEQFCHFQSWVMSLLSMDTVEIQKEFG